MFKKFPNGGSVKNKVNVFLLNIYFSSGLIWK